MLVPPSPSSTESSSASQGGHHCRKGHLEPLASGRNAEPSVQPAAREHRGHPTPLPKTPPRPPQPPTKGSFSQDPPPILLPRAASHRTPTSHGIPHTSHQGHPPNPRAASHRTFLDHLPPGQHLTGPPPPPPNRAASQSSTIPTSHQGSFSQDSHLHPNPHPRTASHRLRVTRTPPPVSGFREEIEDCFPPHF